MLVTPRRSAVVLALTFTTPASTVSAQPATKPDSSQVQERGPATSRYTLPNGVTRPPPGSTADEHVSPGDRLFERIDRRSNRIERSICRGC